jgi:hypothetical protein
MSFAKAYANAQELGLCSSSSSSNWASYTNATIFAPSVRLPAPSVTRQSALASLASVTISIISDHNVCETIPFLTPTTWSSPRADVSRSRASVLRERVPEQIM